MKLEAQCQLGCNPATPAALYKVWPLSRNRNSTHKVLAPRIDSKSKPTTKPTTRPTIENHNQNGDKNNQRTSIEQRGSKPKGKKKKPE